MKFINLITMAAILSGCTYQMVPKERLPWVSHNQRTLQQASLLQECIKENGQKSELCRKHMVNIVRSMNETVKAQARCWEWVVIFLIAIKRIQNKETLEDGEFNAVIEGTFNCLDQQGEP